jgi:hypothetical protein
LYYRKYYINLGAKQGGFFITNKLSGFSENWDGRLLIYDDILLIILMHVNEKSRREIVNVASNPSVKNATKTNKRYSKVAERTQDGNPVSN